MPPPPDHHRVSHLYFLSSPSGAGVRKPNHADLVRYIKGAGAIENQKMKSTAHSSSLMFSSLCSRRHPLSTSHRRRSALPHRNHQHAASSSQLARSPSVPLALPPSKPRHLSQKLLPILRFLFPASLIIINDIAAYIFGFFFGKTPLIKLSPKKTWEGFIGASVTTISSAFVVRLCLFYFCRESLYTFFIAHVHSMAFWLNFVLVAFVQLAYVLGGLHVQRMYISDFIQVSLLNILFLFRSVIF